MGAESQNIALIFLKIIVKKQKNSCLLLNCFPQVLGKFLTRSPILMKDFDFLGNFTWLGIVYFTYWNIGLLLENEWKNIETCTVINLQFDEEFNPSTELGYHA